MYLVLIILNLPLLFYNTSLITTNYPVAGRTEPPVLYKCNTSVIISVMFEHIRDLRAAR